MLICVISDFGLDLALHLQTTSWLQRSAQLGSQVVSAVLLDYGLSALVLGFEQLVDPQLALLVTTILLRNERLDLMF